jgi:CheY-like chemotaxis protein
MLLWTDYLVDAGYQVVQIADGAEVLSQAIHEEPQAILLDLALPHADGWEVLNLLKSHPVTRDIPVIIVTSLDEEPGAVALGAADYLRKPVNRPHLLESLQQVFIGANRRSGWGGRPRDPETPARLENEGPHVQGAGDNPEKCGS